MAGDRLSSVGLIAEAINTYKKNLTSSSDDVAAGASTNIANSFEKLKILDSMLFYNKKAYQILIRENRRQLSIYCINVGVSYLYPNGNLDSARLYLNRGMLIAKEINMPDVFESAYRGFGELAVQRS